MQKLNLNTILLSITVSLLGWIGYTTHANSKDNAGSRVTIQNLSDNFAKMERRMEEAVPRREFDLQMAQIKSELSLARATQTKIETQLNVHELELFKLKQAAKIP
jgi:hypothetical protein